MPAWWRRRMWTSMRYERLVSDLQRQAATAIQSAQQQRVHAIEAENQLNDARAEAAACRQAASRYSDAILRAQDVVEQMEELARAVGHESTWAPKLRRAINGEEGVS